MAIGGSFNQSTFTQKDPMQMLWERRMVNYETQNTFARGVDPEQAVARPVDMLGSVQNITSGGRNYGDQSLDRGELQRLANTGSAFINLARKMAQQPSPGGSPSTPRQPQQQAPAPPSQRQQRRQTRQLAKQGVTPPPQPAQQQPKTLPAPVPATPHPNASGKWREEQAQRIAEWELGEPGQPTPDPSVGSRSYLEKVARRRAERAGQPPAPTAPRATSAQRLERAGQLKAEREAAVAARGGRGPTPPGAVSNRRSPDLLPPNMRPGAVGTVKMPSPVGLAGGQAERLSAEGSMPATPPKRTRKKS